MLTVVSLLLIYLIITMAAFLLASIYYKKTDLEIDEIDILLFIIPLVNIGALLGVIYCIVTKRHYN